MAETRPIPKIDAHHHLWDIDSGNYPWLTTEEPVKRIYGDTAQMRFNYRLKEYLNDLSDQNIVKSVHVQTGWRREDPVGETQHLQQIADSNAGGFPHAIIAAASLHQDDIQQVLEAHCESANMRGVRLMLNWHENPVYRWAARPDYMSDGKFIEGFKLLSRYGLSFDCQIYPAQFHQAAALSDTDPETPFVILHCGMPVDRDEAGLKLWRDGLKELAERPQVSIKFCGLSMLIHDWNAAIMRDYLHQIVEIFGTGRVMIASNFPVDRIKGSLNDYFDAYGAAMEELSADEQKKLFHHNAARIYRLD